MNQSWESLSFIDHFLKHNEEFESPNSFWQWAAYGTVASVLRDNVFKRMGNGRLFPNIYTLALAESGFHRKGAPVEFAEDLVREIKNTKVISGRASIQAIVQELSRTETDKTTGRLVKAGSATFFAPELSAGIVGDPAAIGILTDIYDCKKNYDTLLKTQAKASISSLVFSMVAASNEDMLKKFYDISALRGGLLARTFLVIPDEFRKPNALIDIPEYVLKAIEASKKCLVEKLKRIASLSGEITFSDEAQATYNQWYIPFRRDQSSQRDKSGVLGRLHTGIVKLSMILAVNENKLIVEEKHIGKAIDTGMALIPNYTKLALSGTNSTIGEAGAIVLADLVGAKDFKMSRRELFRRHLLEFDHIVFDNLITSLETAGLITQILDNNQMYYKLTEAAIVTMKGQR